MDNKEISPKKDKKPKREKRSYIGRPQIDDPEFIEIAENYKKRRELTYICLKKGVDCSCDYCKFSAGYDSKDRHYKMRIVTKCLYKPKMVRAGSKKSEQNSNLR